MSLLITTRRSIAGLFLDATVAEDFASKSTVTQNPVEFGASINDHSIRLPSKYILSGRVTDTPLRPDDDDSWSSGTQDTRSKSAWEVLNQLKDDAEPFVIESGLERLDDMVIESLTATKNAANANVLDFRAECTELIITNTQDVAVNFPEPGPTEQQATEEVDRGDVQAVTPTEEKQKSWLLKGAEIIGAVE